MRACDLHAEKLHEVHQQKLIAAQQDARGGTKAREEPVEVLTRIEEGEEDEDGDMTRIVMLPGNKPADPFDERDELLIVGLEFWLRCRAMRIQCSLCCGNYEMARTECDVALGESEIGSDTVVSPLLRRIRAQLHTAEGELEEADALYDLILKTPRPVDDAGFAKHCVLSRIFLKSWRRQRVLSLPLSWYSPLLTC